MGFRVTSTLAKLARLRDGRSLRSQSMSVSTTAGAAPKGTSDAARPDAERSVAGGARLRNSAPRFAPAAGVELLPRGRVDDDEGLKPSVLSVCAPLSKSRLGHTFPVSTASGGLHHCRSARSGPNCFATAWLILKT